jgi:hypothetical protein
VKELMLKNTSIYKMGVNKMGINAVPASAKTDRSPREVMLNRRNPFPFGLGLT